MNPANKPPIHPQLDQNLQQIRAALGQSPDITIRELEIGDAPGKAAVAYTDNISDKNMINRFILDTLMNAPARLSSVPERKTLFDFIRSNALTVGEVNVIQDWDSVILSILSGDTVIFVDGEAQAIVCGTRGGEQRSVEESSSQLVIQGPRDGFAESIGTNVALVRRRIRSSNLWLESMKLGRLTQTDVAIMYIKGIAEDSIVQEARDRLNKLKDLDSVQSPFQVEEAIQDKLLTPFPTMMSTERPDSVAANLLEGRIAIFVDGNPFVLVAPVTFSMFFQSAEDYYQRFETASAIRLLRYAALFISLFVPSIYISVITFHQEMIPTPLLFSVAAQREHVPFPAFIEAIIMEVTFEILREAGIRMPRAIGQAVSIVGAIVLGQAAVEAGIVSPVMVIVVSITGIASLATPAFTMALSIRLLRFFIMFSAAMLGLYGVVLTSIILLGHMCGLRSFNTPYMTPFGPMSLKEQKDTLLRLPAFLTPRLKNYSNKEQQP